jgi:hypothetical protein
MAKFTRTVAGLAVALVALAGCAALADVAALSGDLQDAGYRSTSVNHNTVNGYSTLSIAATMPDEVPTEADGDEIAELVWTTYSGEFDQLQVTLNGKVVVNETADELRARFGDRPEGMADGGSAGGSPVVLIVVVVVIALVFTGLMVLVWHRGRRRAAAAAPQPVHPYQYPHPYQRPPDGR